MVNYRIPPDSVVLSPCMVYSMPGAILYIIIKNITKSCICQMDSIPSTSNSSLCANNPVVMNSTGFNTIS